MVEIKDEWEKLIWWENIQGVIDWTSKELKVGMNVEVLCSWNRFSILWPSFEDAESPIDWEIIVDNKTRKIVSNYAMIWEYFEFDDWWDETKYIVRVWDTTNGKTNWLDLDTWHFIWVIFWGESDLFSMVWDIQEKNWLRYFIANSSKWNCVVLLDSNPIWYIVWWVFFEEHNPDIEEVDWNLFFTITTADKWTILVSFPEWKIENKFDETLN